MKFFPTHGNAVPEKPKKASALRTEKSHLSRKKEMSASDIKEKLAAHVQTSSASKQTAIKNTTKLGEAFINHTLVAPVIPFVGSDEEISKAKKDQLAAHGLATNDPTDSNTQEKLKTILTKGGFNFSAREKEVLGKILA